MNDNFEEKRGRGYDGVEIFRTSDTERDMLNRLMIETDRSKSDIIRSAIHFYYRNVMNRR